MPNAGLPTYHQRATLQPFPVILAAHGQRITSEQKPGRMAGQWPKPAKKPVSVIHWPLPKWPQKPCKKANVLTLPHPLYESYHPQNRYRQ